MWPTAWLIRSSKSLPNLFPMPEMAFLSFSEVMLCFCTFQSLHLSGRPHLTPHCMWVGTCAYLWPTGKKWWYETSMGCPRKHSWSQELRRTPSQYGRRITSPWTAVRRRRPCPWPPPSWGDDGRGLNVSWVNYSCRRWRDMTAMWW